jgi:hypothetical protein
LLIGCFFVVFFTTRELLFVAGSLSSSSLLSHSGPGININIIKINHGFTRQRKRQK